jgi:hypothetical protein
MTGNAADPRGFVQVSGSRFPDTLPDVLRNADKRILAARNTHRKAPQKTKAVDLALSQAESRLLYQGHMADDLTRRYFIPIDSPDYAKGKTQPKAPQGLYGTDEWTTAYGMRNGVESVNADLKRPQYEDIGDPEKRAVRGNTFTYMVVALAAIVENLPQIVSFHNRKLAIKKVTAKNKDLPTIFWQSNVSWATDPPDALAAA